MVSPQVALRIFLTMQSYKFYLINTQIRIVIAKLMGEVG